MISDRDPFGITYQIESIAEIIEVSEGFPKVSVDVLAPQLELLAKVRVKSKDRADNHFGKGPATDAFAHACPSQSCMVYSLTSMNSAVCDNMLGVTFPVV